MSEHRSARSSRPGRRGPSRGALALHVAIALAVICSVMAGQAVVTPTPAAAVTVPPGFQQQTVISGLTEPTTVRFSPDGRVFVAEKSGIIKVFDSINDTNPTIFADLRTEVHNYWDRGLLNMELAQIDSRQCAFGN